MNHPAFRGVKGSNEYSLDPRDHVVSDAKYKSFVLPSHYHQWRKQFKIEILFFFFLSSCKLFTEPFYEYV